MRTSLLVASVALVTLAILFPIEAGRVPYGMEVASKHAKASKYSADKESRGSKSSSSADVGDYLVKKEDTCTSDSDDYETESCETDEKVVNTGRGQQKAKSYKSKSKKVDKDRSSRTSKTVVVPDDDDCGC